VQPSLNGYEPARSLTLINRVQQELATTPGVTAVAASVIPLLNGSSAGSSVSVQGFRKDPDTDVGASFNMISAGYFRALGVPLLAGRELVDADFSGGQKVALVNEAFARKFNLGRDAVGKFMAQSDGENDKLDVQIVGLVADAKYSAVKDEIPPLFFTPYSQDHGVTLAMVLTLATTTELLDDALSPDQRTRTCESVARACRFAASSDEDYAFINNHQAAFALAYLRACRLTGDESLAARADEVLDRVCAHQSADGWFEEYGGPDPGYETFGLTYLALANAERRHSVLPTALGRSVEFLSHFVHPDGSIGGNYGSRNTGQYAPGGLEVLAPQHPTAAAIADFVGQRLDQGNVVTPLRCDDDNLPLLTFSYAVAATRAVARAGRSPALPCESGNVLRQFDDSRIVVAATQRYYAVANLSKGGTLRVFDRETATIAYEDAGYFLSSEGGDWSTQLLGESVATLGEATQVAEVTTRFAAVKRELMTPAKFLVLRILNLTVFRSVRLGAMVRRMIIARLITGRERGAWRLRRSVAFEAERIVLHDEVIPDAAERVTFASLERSLLPIHMGSAKYFHANELVAISLPTLSGWSEALSAGRSVSLSQTIGFVGGEVSHEHQIDPPLRTTSQPASRTVPEEPFPA
ncbi:MAG: ABC transporter permease, partial [Gemmatimonadota bacterium]